MQFHWFQSCRNRHVLPSQTVLIIGSMSFVTKLIYCWSSQLAISNGKTPPSEMVWILQRVSCKRSRAFLGTSFNWITCREGQQELPCLTEIYCYLFSKRSTICFDPQRWHFMFLCRIFGCNFSGDANPNWGTKKSLNRGWLNCMHTAYIIICLHLPNTCIHWYTIYRILLHIVF